jgi:hypothetical protein
MRVSDREGQGGREYECVRVRVCVFVCACMHAWYYLRSQRVEVGCVQVDEVGLDVQDTLCQGRLEKSLIGRDHGLFV